jgi:hypothetical protein
MDEAEFWVSLEFRIDREFAGMTNGRLRNLWCDGFAVGRYDFEAARPSISGVAWICEGSKQEEWEFTLLLPRHYAGRAGIVWDELMPAENVTRWLSVDESRRRIEMEPGVAAPDGGEARA